MIASGMRQQGFTKPSLARRAGLTLLEVLIALAIFLLAMVVFGEMIIRNGELAADLQRQNKATGLCQSKMSEVVSGVVPLTSQGDVPFDEDSDYTWTIDAQNGSVDNLWNVTLTVKCLKTNGRSPIQSSLTQMVLDPTAVGNTQDVTPVISSPPSTTQ